MRGGIVDLYAPDMPKPCRIEFWGDEVDNIRTFDLVSQRREGAVKKIYLSPAREVLFGDTAETAARLRAAIGRAKGPRRAAMEHAAAADLAALDAGTMPCALDKYLGLRYEKPALVLEYLEHPLVFFSEPSAIREAARALAFRFGEEMKGLLEEGVLCAGLDKFYEDGAALWQAAGKHSAVLCENFARTVPDVRLTATVNMPAHALPPWAGEVRALAEELEPLLAQKYAVCVLAGTRRAGEALARDLARAGLSAAFYAKLPQALSLIHI